MILKIRKLYSIDIREIFDALKLALEETAHRTTNKVSILFNSKSAVIVL